MLESLTEWTRAHPPKDTLFFKDGFGDQIIFVRENIAAALASSYEEWKSICDGEKLMVIGEHISKSVKLPVFFLRWHDFEFVLRYNFYDWKVSVKADHDVEIDFKNLFDKDKIWAYHYCEGFPKDRVYGSRHDSPREFTVEISNKYDLYVFFWLIRRG